MNLTSCAAAILLCLSGIQVSAQVDRPPNLLVLHTDEHNFRTLGCYRATLKKDQALMWGEAVVETPHIDWLADQGVLCTSFYATTPVCAPSRASFVSGLYPQKTAVVTNNMSLNDDIVTFATVLQEQGYETGYAGKWHLDGPSKPGWAPKRQFGFEDNRFMFNRGHWKQLAETDDRRSGMVASRDDQGNPTYGVAGADSLSFTTDFLTDRAIDFIRQKAEVPFCYMVSFPDPHGPNTVRGPYADMYKEVEIQPARTFVAGVSGTNGARGVERHDMAQYYGMAKCIDDNVGRLLEVLRESGILEHTIIVFTSDHGDMCGEHGRVNKGVAYEASAKVPFIAFWAGQIAQGKVIDQAMSCIDFLPTILQVMSAPAIPSTDGRDFSHLFRDKRSKARGQVPTIIRGTPGQDWVAAITARYKLVYRASGIPQLFDLKRDPDELVNDYDRGRLRGVRQRLAQALHEYGENHDDPHLQLPMIKEAVDKDRNGVASNSGSKP